MSNPNFDLTKFDYAPWYAGRDNGTHANVGKHSRLLEDVIGVNGNGTPMLDNLKDNIAELKTLVKKYTVYHDKIYRANADDTQEIAATASSDALNNSAENQLILTQLKTDINVLTRDINATISQITQLGEGNRMAIDSNVTKLLQINQGGSR